MWDSEMIVLIRNIIDDVDEPVKYSDDRLGKLLLTAAQLAQGENVFLQSYTIDVDNITLKPDPTRTPRDESFINLTVLKAACLLASSGLLKIGPQSIMVREGSYQFDARGALTGRQAAVDTWCNAYTDARWELVRLGSGSAGHAIIGPYRNLALASPSSRYHRGSYK